MRQEQTGRAVLSSSVTGLACIITAAVTAAAMAVVIPVDPPPTLGTADPLRGVRVTQRDMDDERQVELVLETGAPRVVVSSRSGVVTALHCATGGTLRSGDVVAEVDGRPVIAFASSSPLWRDVAAQDRGDDVRDLQRELDRLGFPTSVDGVAGPSTIRAALRFLRSRGLDPTSATSAAPATSQTAANTEQPTKPAVPRDAFAWIPSAETVVSSCTAVVGAELPERGELVSLPAELRSARIRQLPAGSTPGVRRLVIGQGTMPVRDDGVVDDAAGLAALAESPGYQSTSVAPDAEPTLAASWVLADPVRVDVVPPSALWDVSAGGACVGPTGGDPVAVEVLGSELGQSFVRVASGPPLDRVDAVPDRGRSCR